MNRETLKQRLDALAGVTDSNQSWLDASSQEGALYTMRRDPTIPALRYTAKTFTDQSGAKRRAEKLQTALWNKGLNLRVDAHRTIPLDGSDPYWKIEVYIPRLTALE